MPYPKRKGADRSRRPQQCRRENEEAPTAITLGAKEDGRCSVSPQPWLVPFEVPWLRELIVTRWAGPDVSHICPYTSLTTATWVRCRTRDTGKFLWSFGPLKTVGPRWYGNVQMSRKFLQRRQPEQPVAFKACCSDPAEEKPGFAREYASRIVLWQPPSPAQFTGGKPGLRSSRPGSSYEPLCTKGPLPKPTGGGGKFFSCPVIAPTSSLTETKAFGIDSLFGKASRTGGRNARRSQRVSSTRS